MKQRRGRTDTSNSGLPTLCLRARLAAAERDMATTAGSACSSSVTSASDEFAVNSRLARVASGRVCAPYNVSGRKGKRAQTAIALAQVLRSLLSRCDISCGSTYMWVLSLASRQLPACIDLCAWVRTVACAPFESQQFFCRAAS